jgi:hypothetical protein
MCICTPDRNDKAETLFSGKDMLASTSDAYEEEEVSEEVAAAVEAMQPCEATS